MCKLDSTDANWPAKTDTTADRPHIAGTIWGRGWGVFTVYYYHGWDMGTLLHARNKKNVNAMAPCPSPNPKKAKTTFSVGKIMATFFRYMQDVLYLDLLKEQQTVNAEYCSSLLEGPLKTGILNKRKKARRLSTSYRTIPFCSLLFKRWQQFTNWSRLFFPIHNIVRISLHWTYISLDSWKFFGGRKFTCNDEVIKSVWEWMHL